MLTELGLDFVLLLAAGVAAIAFVIRDEKRASQLEIVASNFHERIAALEVRWSYLAEQAGLEVAEQRIDALEKLIMDDDPEPAPAPAPKRLRK